MTRDAAVISSTFLPHTLRAVWALRMTRPVGSPS